MVHQSIFMQGSRKQLKLDLPAKKKKNDRLSLYLKFWPHFFYDSEAQLRKLKHSCQYVRCSLNNFAPRAAPNQQHVKSPGQVFLIKRAQHTRVHQRRRWPSASAATAYYNDGRALVTTLTPAGVY